MGTLGMIVAVGKNREIGKDGDLLWTCKDDLKKFALATKGCTLIVGRKTWDSLPLKMKSDPQRKFVIVSHKLKQTCYHINDGHVVLFNDTKLNHEYCSLETALAYCKSLVKHTQETAWVIGGQSIYEAFLRHPQLSRVNVSEFDLSSGGADTFFPELSENEFVLTGREVNDHEITDKSDGGGLRARVMFLTYRRLESLIEKAESLFADPRSSDGFYVTEYDRVRDDRSPYAWSEKLIDCTKFDSLYRASQDIERRLNTYHLTHKLEISQTMYRITLTHCILHAKKTFEITRSDADGVCSVPITDWRV